MLIVAPQGTVTSRLATKARRQARQQKDVRGRTATQGSNGTDGSWLVRLEGEHSQRVSTLEQVSWPFLSTSHLPASTNTCLWLFSHSYSSCPHSLLTRSCSPLILHSSASLTLKRHIGMTQKGVAACGKSHKLIRI